MERITFFLRLFPPKKVRIHYIAADCCVEDMHQSQTYTGERVGSRREAKAPVFFYDYIFEEMFEKRNTHTHVCVCLCVGWLRPTWKQTEQKKNLRTFLFGSVCVCVCAVAPFFFFLSPLAASFASLQSRLAIRCSWMLVVWGLRSLFGCPFAFASCPPSSWKCWAVRGNGWRNKRDDKTSRKKRKVQSASRFRRRIAVSATATSVFSRSIWLAIRPLADYRTNRSRWPISPSGLGVKLLLPCCTTTITAAAAAETTRIVAAAANRLTHYTDPNRPFCRPTPHESRRRPGPR